MCARVGSVSLRHSSLFLWGDGFFSLIKLFFFSAILSFHDVGGNSRLIVTFFLAGSFKIFSLEVIEYIE